MYDDFYKLTGKPFQLTPDSKFFFNSKVHNRAMAYLRYGLEQGEGFIVITGGIGTGKTMLVRNLFKEIENKDVMAAQLVTTQVEPDDMLRMVCASFGLAHEGLNKATMLHNLEVIARTRHSEGKRVLLVIDEAQNLPARSVEELRMLSNFQVEGKALFQSFLLGQEEFKRTLQAPGMEQVRQRIIASYHLDPLGPDETKRYIEHRLKLVGWKDDPKLDNKIFSGIHEFTGGVPRRVNALCDRMMLYGCLEELHKIDDEALETVIEEMRREVSQPQHPASFDVVQDEPVKANSHASDSYSYTASSANRDLMQRLSALEEEIGNLKKTVQHERKLLRKAILLQMDMDEYDEV